jgi:hypothetical protein
MRWVIELSLALWEAANNQPSPPIIATHTSTSETTVIRDLIS